MAHNKDKSLSDALDAYQAGLAVSGDQQAFELLYKRWHPKLLRFAIRLIGQVEPAQDVMQDAALCIAKSIRRLEDPHKFGPWAYQIVRRRAADYIRNNVRDRIGKDRLSQENQKQILLDGETQLSLKQALGKINESDRLLLTLFYIDGLTGRELSAAMKIPLGTVKSRLFNARDKLKSIYDTQPKGDGK